MSEKKEKDLSTKRSVEIELHGPYSPCWVWEEWAILKGLTKCSKFFPWVEWAWLREVLVAGYLIVQNLS